MRNRDYVKIGKRLKEEKKKHKIRNSDLLDLMGYETSPSTASDFFKGKRHPSDDSLRLIAKKWGYRPEYLLCEDNSPTEEDKYKSTGISLTSSFRIWKAYHKMLGLKIDPHLLSKLMLYDLYKIIENVSPHLSPETLQFLYDHFDLSLHIKDAKAKYNNIPITVFWKEPPSEANFNIQSIDMLRRGNHDTFNIEGVEITLIPIFEITYKDLRKIISADELLTFMQQADAFARCSIETLLIND